MSAPFDGTGRPYRGSSARGWIVVAMVIVVILAVIWASYSDALSIFDTAPPGPYGPAPIDNMPDGQ
jgi:hypothetical protein